MTLRGSPSVCLTAPPAGLCCTAQKVVCVQQTIHTTCWRLPCCASYKQLQVDSCSTDNQCCQGVCPSGLCKCVCKQARVSDCRGVCQHHNAPVLPAMTWLCNAGCLTTGETCSSDSDCCPDNLSVNQPVCSSTTRKCKGFMPGAASGRGGSCLLAESVQHTVLCCLAHGADTGLRPQAASWRKPDAARVTSAAVGSATVAVKNVSRGGVKLSLRFEVGTLCMRKVKANLLLE